MQAIARSRNFLHTSLSVTDIRSGFKECPPSEKGRIETSSVHHKDPHSVHCACLLHISPHTRKLCTDIHRYRRTTKGKRREGPVFLCPVCPMFHLSMKGRDLYVKYYKDNFKISRNFSLCVHWLEPSHQLVAPCSWVIMQKLLLIIYVKSFRRCKIWGPNVSLHKYCRPRTQVI